MDEKLLVTLRTPEDADVVRSVGGEVLAEYPDSLLVRATTEQREALRQAGVEATPLEQPPIRLAGASFDFARAVEADEAVPVSTEPNRTAYFLIKLIGPAKGEWLNGLRARGATIHGNLPGFSVLVGIVPSRLEELRAQPWVEAITPYRAAMKISAKLRPGVSRDLSVAELATVELPADEPASREQVEISVFPGESTAEVAARIRDAGDVVLRETPREVIAAVSPGTIAALAEEQAVEAIVPHALPELHNDRSAPILGVLPDRTFGSLTLRGAGQIVAVADSGLDTGDPTAIHQDFSGRVVDIVSWPTRPGLAQYTHDPPSNDDGPADVSSGHGTHVTGSVLGDGSAADAVGDPTVPRGIAPEAQVYFQAIEQRVNWKSLAELTAAGLTPFGRSWPPSAASLWGLPEDLNELFAAAYAAGARIHTNSWGAAVDGAYNANSRQVDEFLWGHRDMLLLFSAGNDGQDEDHSGVVDSDSIGSPGTAKNCLTVGASEGDRPPGSDPPTRVDLTWDKYPGGPTPRFPDLGAAGHVSDNVDGMAAFSSRGPTDDGRIKPDVVAPGTNILSTRSSVYNNPGRTILWGDLPADHPLRGLYCWSGGTSMSTPLVAGAAALVRQYLIQERGHVQAGVKPSGALLKALLINGAVSIAGQFAGEVPSGPSSIAGFGRVNLTETLGLDGPQPVVFSDEPDLAVETGQMRTLELQAVDLGRPLKVTLVWTDAPGSPNHGGLQNLLYLQVRDPSGLVVDGDVAAFPTATNNVQQVTIATPVAGPYEIRVRGVSIVEQSPGAAGGPNPRQDFALAASNAISPLVQPEPVETTSRLRIEDVRVEPRGAVTVISARVMDETDVATPSEQAEVGVHVAVGGRERNLVMRYKIRARRYQTRSRARLRGARLTVRATRNGDSAEHTMDLPG